MLDTIHFCVSSTLDSYKYTVSPCSLLAEWKGHDWSSILEAGVQWREIRDKGKGNNWIPMSKKVGLGYYLNVFVPPYVAALILSMVVFADKVFGR